MEESDKVGIEELQSVGGANREAKAYAYLYAAFKRTEIGDNPVRDALDCFIPFVTPFLNSIEGKQVTLDGIQKHLKYTYGFELPLYAIEQMLPELQSAGLIQYERRLKIYRAIGGGGEDYKFSRQEIETDFDHLEAGLKEHAEKIGYLGDPSFGTWGDALIQFLRNSTDEAPVKITKIKNVLLEPRKVELAVVGGYIKKLHLADKFGFERLVRVFMGVLIEDFLSTISEVSQPTIGHEVIIFLDTAILLRLMGCSGKMHRAAAEELVRYLQDIGFQTYFLPGNEAEVAGIIDAIIFAKDSGRELEGETAESIANGEVTITEIRVLKGTFPEVLAGKNVFSADALSDVESKNVAHQIDEAGFSEFLKQEASSRGRVYGYQNRANDAGYLGTVMRIRAGRKSRDIASSKCVFVTSNKFLAVCAKRFMVQRGGLKPQHCPPMLSVGQLATIAWLLKDQKLIPEKAGRDLLTNCFAAIRPDQQWFKDFREGMVKSGVSLEETSGDNALLLQAARRIAQEQSFSEAAVVRELNMAEILQRAQIEIDLQADSERRNTSQELERLEAAAETQKENAVKSAIEETRIQIENEMIRKARERAEYTFRLLRNALFLLSICLFPLIFWFQYIGKPTKEYLAILGILAFLDILAIADLFGIKTVRNLTAIIRTKLEGLFLKL